MNISDKQSFIRRKAVENQYDPHGNQILWSRHAISEAVNDGLVRREVESALENCEVIEDYPVKHQPLPDCLVLSFLETVHPVHAVIALDEVKDRILLVTVYRPNLERWENDWRTRK